MLLSKIGPLLFLIDLAPNRNPCGVKSVEKIVVTIQIWFNLTRFGNVFLNVPACFQFLRHATFP